MGRDALFVKTTPIKRKIMKKSLISAFVLILISMLIVTTWASLHENVIAGGAKIIQEPWGIATLFDTYFGFLTFYFWVVYKENGWISRLVWFVLVMLLGNIAMSVYVLMEIYKIRNDFSIERLLTKNVQ